MSIGIDIVNIDRIKKMYKRYGDRFLKKILTSREMEYLSKIENPNRKLEKMAGMFAAKEAVVKALKSRVSFREIEINYSDRIPLADAKGKKIAISISHEKDYAVAVAFSE